MLRNSFRARLIVGAVLWISAGLLLSGLVLSQLFEELVVRQVDHDLLDHAEELRMSVGRRTDGSIEVVRGLSDARFAVPQSGLYWQIDSPTGQTLRSPSLEHSRLPLEATGTDGLQKMATEIGVMNQSHDKYGTMNISGNYADLAKALGGYGERVEEPGDIQAAIKRGIDATKAGKPALLEFITQKEVAFPK